MGESLRNINVIESPPQVITIPARFLFENVYRLLGLAFGVPLF